MDGRPEAGAAGGRLLNPDGSLQESCYPAPTVFREFWRLFHLDGLLPLGVYEMSRWPLDTPREVDNLMGACMLVRKSAIAQAGPMDEGYYMYSEEIDWCLRIRRAGWRIYWVPAAEIIHFGGQSTRQKRAEMFIYLYRGKVMYFRKHHGRISAGLYKIVLFLASIPRIAPRWLVWLIPPGRRAEQLERAGLYARLIRALPAF
jgi:GT2 family glycosyltransferase